MIHGQYGGGAELKGQYHKIFHNFYLIKTIYKRRSPRNSRVRWLRGLGVGVVVVMEKTCPHWLRRTRDWNCWSPVMESLNFFKIKKLGKEFKKINLNTLLANMMLATNTMAVRTQWLLLVPDRILKYVFHFWLCSPTVHTVGFIPILLKKSMYRKPCVSAFKEKKQNFSVFIRIFLAYL